MKEQSEKIKKVIERMKDTRYEDYKNLRQIAEERIKWCEIEKQKGIQAIRELELQIARIDGALTVLKEILK